MMPSRERWRHARTWEWRKAFARSQLSATAKLVLHTLGLHMNAEGGSCWPSVPLIAREASLEERSLYRHLPRLEREGWIRRQRHPGRSTEYFATVPSELVLVDGEPRHPVQEPLFATPDSLSGDPGHGVRGTPDSLSGKGVQLGDHEAATAVAAFQRLPQPVVCIICGSQVSEAARFGGQWYCADDVELAS